MSTIHKSAKRDYLARVNDAEFPKEKAAMLAKKWEYDYWDGDRRINYSWLTRELGGPPLLTAAPPSWFITSVWALR